MDRLDVLRIAGFTLVVGFGAGIIFMHATRPSCRIVTHCDGDGLLCVYEEPGGYRMTSLLGRDDPSNMVAPPTWDASPFGPKCEFEEWVTRAHKSTEVPGE